jgi:hypothetical protein
MDHYIVEWVVIMAAGQSFFGAGVDGKFEDCRFSFALSA